MTITPANLGPGGKAMWQDLTKGREYDAAWAALIEEACRMKDRLDKMHRLISGDISSWARIEQPDNAEGRYLLLIFDDAVAEARQQANALRQIITSLKLGQANEKSAAPSALDQLAERRKKRRTQASA